MSRNNRFDDFDVKQSANKNHSVMWVALGGTLLLTLGCCGVGSVGYILWTRNSFAGPVQREDIRIGGDRQLAQDPKWRPGTELKALLPGRWRAKYMTAGGYREFLADGRVRHGEFAATQGSYRIVEPENVEFSCVLYSDGVTGIPQPPESYRCLISDEELVFLHQPDSGAPRHEFEIKYKFFRMREDGTGAGDKKLIGPIIADLKGNDKKRQTDACRKIMLGYREDAWTAVPELIRIVEENPLVDPNVIDALANIGPKAKEALPALQKQRALGGNPNAFHAKIAIELIEVDRTTPWGGHKKKINPFIFSDKK